MNRQNKNTDKTTPSQSIAPTAILNIISRTTESLPGREDPLSAKFKELDACIRFENGVTDTLADVVYQDAPGVAQRLDYLLDSLEQICLYPELDARPAYLLTAKNIGALFETFAFLFKKNLPREFLKYNTTPFLIIDDRETRLELVNFANARISGLDFEYYGALLDGCTAQKIAVNQMVKMFILHIPLKISGACLVFDGISGPMKNRLARFLVDSSCLVKNEAELELALKRRFDRVIVDCKINREFHHGMMGCQDFYNGFPFDSRVPIYGFYEEFLYEKNHVMIHYHREIAKKENMSKALRDDSVHLDSDQTLEDLRQKERDIKKKLESDARRLEEGFSTAEKCLDDIRRLLLRDMMSEERFVPYRVSNQVFTMFFEAVEANYDVGVETAFSRMRSLKLQQLPLAEEFYHTKKDRSGDSTAIAQRANNWIEAKILLDRLSFPRNGEVLSPTAHNLLQSLMKYIGRHKTSGKEYYADFLINGDPQSLWKSLELGYREAGTKLYELNKDNTDVLKKLATFLVPKACFALAQKDVAHYLKAWVDAVPADKKPTGVAFHLDQFFDVVHRLKAFADAASVDNRIAGVASPLNQFFSEIDKFSLAYQNSVLNNGHTENQRKQYANPCDYCKINFSAKAFFYLKIAASLRYPPALEYMAQLFYGLFFSSCEILDAENPDPARLKFGKLIIAVFRSGKLERKNINGEIHGVTAFCLGQFEDANKLLLHVNTPRAKYCRGYMYWQGLVGGQDLRQALSLMKEASEDFPPARDAWRRIQNTINARQRTNYNPGGNYRTTRSTSCSSSSCMIIAALGMACNSSPIKQMHTFAHRELGGTECGKAMIREYYRAGGLLIRRLAGHPAARAEYERIREEFQTGVLSQVRKRDYRQAAESMIRLQIELCKKYDINVDDNVLALMKNDRRYSSCLDDIDPDDAKQA